MKIKPFFDIVEEIHVYFDVFLNRGVNVIVGDEGYSIDDDFFLVEEDGVWSLFHIVNFIDGEGSGDCTETRLAVGLKHLIALQSGLVEYLEIIATDRFGDLAEQKLAEREKQLIPSDFYETIGDDSAIIK